MALSGPAQDMEEDLAGLKLFVLEAMRRTLVDNIDPTKFLPFFRSKFVLSARESAEIKSCCSRSVFDGAEKLIDVLCTKGAKGYDTLCEALLYDQTQIFLLKALNQRLELARDAKKKQVLRTRAVMAHFQQQQQMLLQQQQQQQPLQQGGMSAHTTSCLKHVTPTYSQPQPIRHYGDNRINARSPNPSSDDIQVTGIVNQCDHDPQWTDTENIQSTATYLFPQQNSKEPASSAENIPCGQSEN